MTRTSRNIRFFPLALLFPLGLLLSPSRRNEGQRESNKNKVKINIRKQRHILLSAVSDNCPTLTPCPPRHQQQRMGQLMRKERLCAISVETTFLGPQKTRVQIPSTALGGSAKFPCPASQPEAVGNLQALKPC